MLTLTPFGFGLDRHSKAAAMQAEKAGDCGIQYHRPAAAPPNQRNIVAYRKRPQKLTCLPLFTDDRDDNPKRPVLAVLMRQYDEAVAFTHDSPVPSLHYVIMPAGERASGRAVGAARRYPYTSIYWGGAWPKHSPGKPPPGGLILASPLLESKNRYRPLARRTPVTSILPKEAHSTETREIDPCV